jgi:hypothetical protein
LRLSRVNRSDGSNENLQIFIDASWADINKDDLGNTSGTSTGDTKSWSDGIAEALAPVLEDRPGSVHSKENVVHMAAEIINHLPTGTAIVKALVNGRIESALIRLPLVADAKEKYRGHAKTFLLEHSPLALPIVEADKVISDRHEWIRAQGAKLIAPKPAAPDTPKSFRVSGERWAKNPQRKGGKPPEKK